MEQSGYIPNVTQIGVAAFCSVVGSVLVESCTSERNHAPSGLDAIRRTTKSRVLDIANGRIGPPLSKHDLETLVGLHQIFLAFLDSSTDPTSSTVH